MSDKPNLATKKAIEDLRRILNSVTSDGTLYIDIILSEDRELRQRLKEILSAIEKPTRFSDSLRIDQDTEEVRTALKSLGFADSVSEAGSLHYRYPNGGIYWMTFSDAEPDVWAFGLKNRWKTFGAVRRLLLALLGDQ